MSSNGPLWTLERDWLERALERWYATDPSQYERDDVHACLMDLAIDPLVRGHEDPDQPELWIAYGEDTDSLVFYQPWVDAMTVRVVTIESV